MYDLHFTKLKPGVWQATYNNLPVNYTNDYQANWGLEQLRDLDINGQLEPWHKRVSEIDSFTIVVYTDTIEDEAVFIMKASNGVRLKHYSEMKLSL